jgi:Na+-transporting NADH:ubiquinone oxidoreductase subunit B/electron transport complex protein RnfD
MTIALSVLVLASTIIFGYQVLVVAAVSLVTALLVELMFSKGRKIEFDGAWMIYPLLLTLLIPSTLELKHVWMVAVGSAFGTFFGKGIFGGSGKYVFNPALVGLLFITISFPQYFPTMLVGYAQVGTDYTLMQMLLGDAPGALGETLRLGIIILGLVLIGLKVIDWKIPLSIILGTILFTVMVVLISDILVPRYVPSNIINSLFIGNLVLVTFFIATDETTAPIFPWGRVLYGLGIAFLTVVIRYYATFPEGTMFAIILMSAVAPLIDSMFFARIEKKEGATDESKS